MKSWIGRSAGGRAVPRAACPRRRTRRTRRRSRFLPRSWGASPTRCRRSPVNGPARSTSTSSRPTTKQSRQRESDESGEPDRSPASEIESDAETAFDLEPESWYENERRRYLEEHLEKSWVVEHQVQSERGARAQREAVAAAVSRPDRAAADADVPVELRLTAHDVGLPQVVHVEGAVVVAVAGARAVVEAAVVDAVAPEPEAEVERVRGRNPQLRGEAGRIADDDTQAELAVVADLGRLRRARDRGEQRHRHQGGQDGPFHGRYSTHERLFFDSFSRPFSIIATVGVLGCAALLGCGRAAPTAPVEARRAAVVATGPGP